MKLPADTRRHAHSPELAPGAHGIAIAAAVEDGALVLHGAFRIPWRDAEAIEPPRHRAIVLVASAPGGYAVLSPFCEQVLCDDDEQATSGGAFGWFNLDVTALLGEARPGDCHLLVSLGPHTSNVLRARI